MRKKALLLVGFFGEGNLGDEAILEGLVASIPAQTPCFVTSGTQGLTGQGRTSVISLPRRGLAGFLAFCRRLSQVDHVIVTGGCLQDWSADGVLFYALRLMAAGAAGKPASLWGAGLGPLRKPWARSLAGRSLKKVRTAWLRDRFSGEVFQDLTGREAFLGADWSWALKEGEQGSAGPSGTMGINLRPWAFQEWDRGAVQTFKREGSVSHLIGISARGEDERVIKQIFPGGRVVSPGRFSDLLKLCRGLEAGWAMRYHVVLAMLRAGIPVVPLPYDEKVRAIAAEAGIECPDSTRIPFYPGKASDQFVPTQEKRFQAMKTAFENYLQGGR